MDDEAGCTGTLVDEIGLSADPARCEVCEGIQRFSGDASGTQRHMSIKWMLHRSASPIDYDPLKISRHLAEAIEKATVGDADPKTVLDEAAAKSNALLRTHVTIGAK